MTILIPEWRVVLKKAWSIKFTGLSLLLSAAEVFVQLLDPKGINGGVFASLAAMTTLAAGISRLLAQKEVTDAKVNEPK